MRLVQVLVPDDTREGVLEALEGLEVDFVVTDDDRAGETGAVVFFPIPIGGVEPVFDELHEQGLSEDAYTVLTKASSASSKQFPELQQRYSSEEGFSVLPRVELQGKIRSITWGRLTYYVGTLISVLVAMAGLLVDSVALVVGAMVIAPQVSTAISASVGVILADWNTFRDSIRRQLLGLGLAIVAVAGISWLVRQSGVVPPRTTVTSIELMQGRLAPGVLTTLGAFGAGAAGAFGFTTEQSNSLVGVMVAAAIIPAAAAVGIAVAWSLPLLALGATVLLLVNLLAINLGSLVVLGVLGYAPERPVRQWLPDHGSRTSTALVALLLVSTVVVGGLTASQVQFQQGTNAATQDVLEDPAYDDLELVQINAEYAGPGATAVGTPEVTVTITRPSNQAYPELADALASGIQTRTGTDSTVSVTYRESSTAT